jgi:hypothetical protein
MLAAASVLEPTSHVTASITVCEAPHDAGLTSQPYGTAMAARNIARSAKGISRLPTMTSPLSRRHGAGLSQGARARWYTRSSPPYWRWPCGVTAEHTHASSMRMSMSNQLGPNAVHVPSPSGPRAAGSAAVVDR